MSDLDWPMMDFSWFPKEQISGLTLEEINDFINNVKKDDKNTNNQHFTNPVGDDQLIQEQQKSVTGTKKRNNWALKLYDEWSKQRMITESDSHNYLPQVHQLQNASVES